MHSNVLKDVSRPDDNNAVPFRNWVMANSGRIPGRAVAVDESELEGLEGADFDHRDVIHRSKARIAGKHVAVNMLPVAALNVYGSAGTASPLNPNEDEDPRPFGLTQEEYDELHDQWEEQQREQIAEAQERVRKSAYEEGYAAASAEAQEEIHELRTLLTQGMREIESRWTAHLEEIEPHLGRLALEIAERILDAPLPEEIHHGVAAAIHDAIDQLTGDTRTDITLHPADYVRLEETGLLEQLNASYESLHWHSDPEIEQRGNWIVETPRAAIRHMKDEMLADIEQTLELP